MFNQQNAVPLIVGAVLVLTLLKWGDDVPILEMVAKPVRKWTVT
jgi:hypothetical protein